MVKISIIYFISCCRVSYEVIIFNERIQFNIDINKIAASVIITCNLAGSTKVQIQFSSNSVIPIFIHKSNIDYMDYSVDGTPVSDRSALSGHDLRESCTLVSR